MKQKTVEIPGKVTRSNGAGNLPKIDINTPSSTAEVYLQGAHVTGFQKTGEPPLLFMSRLSEYIPGKPIRGGVPICLPWFGPRAGDVGHGFARISDWEPISAKEEAHGGITLCLRLSETAAKASWPAFTTEFFISVSDTLTMELVTTNTSTQVLEFEDCLHTYFAVSAIGDVAITGLEGAHYLDKADQGLRKQEGPGPITITRETNRTYPDASGAIEIHDKGWKRTVCVEKSGSVSSVVWNPWTTQRMPDLAVEEHQHMVCVESGNVGSNKRKLAPGATARLKVILASRALSSE